MASFEGIKITYIQFLTELSKTIPEEGSIKEEIVSSPLINDINSSLESPSLTKRMGTSPEILRTYSDIFLICFSAFSLTILETRSTSK